MGSEMCIRDRCILRSLAEGHAGTLADAKNFIVDTARPRVGVDYGEDRLQDKCCSLIFFIEI